MQQHPLTTVQRDGILTYLARWAGRPVTITGEQPLGHRWAPVTRLHLGRALPELGASVVVKTVRTTGTGHGSPPYLRREAAGLITAAPSGVAPRLLHLEDRDGWVLQSDLGDVATLHDHLMAACPDSAAAAVVQLGDAVGRLHAGTIDRQHEQAQDRSPTDVRSGLVYEAGLGCWEKVERACDDLDLPSARPVRAEVIALEDRVRRPDQWGALVHRDLNPTNVLSTPGGVRLVDFESSSHGHLGIDACFLHYPFPHHSVPWGRLPAVVVRQADAAYRAALAAGGAHDVLDRYDQVLADGAAHVLISRLSRLALIARTDQPVEDTRRRRGQVVDQIRTLRRLAEHAPDLDLLRDWLVRFEAAARRRWPEIEEMAAPLFPAFDGAAED